VELADLVAGCNADGQADLDAIRLPPCTCGAVETLFRSTDGAVTRLGTRHKQAVNRLHARLVDSGKVVDGIAEETGVRPKLIAPDVDEFVVMEVHR